MARLLGIDIGKTAVRVALIRTAYRSLSLEALGEALVADHGSVEAAIVAAAGGMKADASAVALPGEQSFYRRVSLPVAAKKDLGSVLAFELEATVPFEIDEAVFDHRVLSSGPTSELVTVFVALARIEDVRERLSLVRDALGAEPSRVGTGALPLANLLFAMPELGESASGIAPPIAIVELGETTSDVVVLHQGEAVFARTLSRGTAGLPGSAPALARELRQTFGAFRSTGGEPIGSMMLVGGGASAQGAAEFLSSELGVEVLPVPVPRFEGITQEQQQMVPRFAKAIGLALGAAGRSRGLDLRRGPLEAERSYPFLREKIPVLVGLAAVIVVSLGFSVIAQVRALNTEREVLSEELGRTSLEVLGKKVTTIDEAHELLDRGPEGAEDDPMPAVDAFDVIVALSEAVPSTVVHDVVDLDVNRGHVIIQGTVPTNKDAEAIAAKFKENRCFKDVKIPRTNQFSEGKQKYVLEFDLKCEDAKKPATAAAAAGSARPEGLK